MKDELVGEISRMDFFQGREVLLRSLDGLL